MSTEAERWADPRAQFEIMFEAHQRSILAYALRRTRTEQDAEDATAETFAIAWRRLDAIPPDALPWLYGVARRVLANQRRGDSRRTRLVDRLRHGRPDPVDARTAGGPATTALDALRAEDRELLRLVAWEDLSHAEIAVVLGVSPNAVAIRLHRARRRYAEAFQAAETEALKGSSPIRTSGGVIGSDVAAARREERS